MENARRTFLGARLAPAVAILAVAAIAAGCSSTPRNDEPGDGTFGRREVRGEVLRVDPQGGVLVIATEGGSDVRVSIQENTVVRYQGRDYRPVNLDPGDLVVVHTREDASGGSANADWIEVTRSVQERRGTTSQRDDSSGGWETSRPGGSSRDNPPVYDERSDRERSGAMGTRTYAGTVDWVDNQQGAFGLRTSAGDVLRVSVPFSAGDEVRSSFSRLRRGDRVEVVASPLERDRLELVRFTRSAY